MRLAAILALCALLLALPHRGRAADSASGADVFRNCAACHALTRPDGTVLMRGGALGPDLYGVVGRPAGGLPGYGYGAGLMALHAAGHVWDAGSLAAFIANPNGFLAARLGPGHVSKMPFGLPKGAAEVAAWLAQLR